MTVSVTFTGTTPQDVIVLMGSIGATPLILKRLEALEGSIMSQFTNLGDQEAAVTEIVRQVQDGAQRASDQATAMAQATNDAIGRVQAELAHLGAASPTLDTALEGLRRVVAEQDALTTQVASSAQALSGLLPASSSPAPTPPPVDQPPAGGGPAPAPAGGDTGVPSPTPGDTGATDTTGGTPPPPVDQPPTTGTTDTSGTVVGDPSTAPGGVATTTGGDTVVGGAGQ